MVVLWSKGIQPYVLNKSVSPVSLFVWEPVLHQYHSTSTMVAITKSLLAVAVAFTSLASCLDHANLSGRNDTIEAVADPVKVDSGGSYMRTARLKNGDILAAYSTSDGNDTTIRTVLSSNGGDSWEKLGEVVRGPSSTRDIGNAYPLELPNGRIVLAFRNHDKEEDTNYGFTWFRITLCESKDGGKTWEYVSQIADRQARDRFTGLWEPFLRIGEDGYLQAYISYENSSGDQDNIMRKSTDGGKTWSDPRNVSGDGVDARDGMVGIADTGNGTLM